MLAHPYVSAFLLFGREMFKVGMRIDDTGCMKGLNKLSFGVSMCWHTPIFLCLIPLRAEDVQGGANEREMKKGCVFCRACVVLKERQWPRSWANHENT